MMRGGAGEAPDPLLAGVMPAAQRVEKSIMAAVIGCMVQVQESMAQGQNTRADRDLDSKSDRQAGEV